MEISKVRELKQKAEVDMASILYELSKATGIRITDVEVRTVTDIKETRVAVLRIKMEI